MQELKLAGCAGGEVSSVITGHHFRRIPRRRREHPSAIWPSGTTFQAFLSDRIVERFARITDLKILAIPLDLAHLEDDEEDPPENPTHPACAAFADSDYCRESWQMHLAELRRRPETHWHRCDYGLLCAVAPLVCRDRCVAALKLTCQDSITKEAFERNVELLDILAENVGACEADVLARLLPAREASAEAKPAPASNRADRAVEQQLYHAQVLKALEYIEDRFSDPKLTVRRIARELSIHPDYLAHLFADQVGQRMKRYITTRRIERAKNLLAHTDWQIKRIARETGHANPNWFSCVFGIHTGLTPREHRRRARRQQQTGQNQ